MGFQQADKMLHEKNSRRPARFNFNRARREMVAARMRRHCNGTPANPREFVIHKCCG